MSDIDVNLKSDTFTYTRTFSDDDAAAAEEARETLEFILRRFGARVPDGKPAARRVPARSPKTVAHAEEPVSAALKG
jgi:hypothetical protein